MPTYSWPILLSERSSSFEAGDLATVLAKCGSLLLLCKVNGACMCDSEGLINEGSFEIIFSSLVVVFRLALMSGKCNIGP